MSENQYKTNTYPSPSKKFPWLAAVIFVLVTVGTSLYSLSFIEVELSGFEGVPNYVIPLTTALGALIGGLVALIVNYFLILLLSKAFSEEKEVYSMDILQAQFYSSSISLILGLLLGMFGITGNTLATIGITVVVILIFLAIYYTGQAQHNPDAKQAVTKTQIILGVLSILLTIGTLFINI